MGYRGYVGMDEVGRGPVAGPVTVCALQWLVDEDPSELFPGVRDSKKLTPKRREAYLREVNLLRDRGTLTYGVSSVGADFIDEHGIVPALKRSSGEALAALENVEHVLADHGLPVEGHPCTHLVKGDEREPLIALASIVAKVTRDEAMVSYAEEYAGYHLEKNKGYLTRDHIEAIRSMGVSPVHRKTFLRSYTGGAVDKS